MTSVTGDRQARRPAPCLLRSTRALPLSVSNASREIHHEGTKTRSERGFPARVRCILVDAHGWLRHPLADFEHDSCPPSGGEPHWPCCARHAGRHTAREVIPHLARRHRAQILRANARRSRAFGRAPRGCKSLVRDERPFVSSFLRGENSREAFRATKGGGENARVERRPSEGAHGRTRV